jgi:hypothetical protein
MIWSHLTSKLAPLARLSASHKSDDSLVSPDSVIILATLEAPFAKMNRNRPGFDNREREPLNVDDGAVVNPRFTEEERARIARARQQSNVVVITRPKALGYFSIAFIIVNRMVGEYIVTN